MARGNPEEVPGDEPGTGPADDDDMMSAEGPDVETSFSEDDQAFLNGLSAPGGETTAPTETATAGDYLADYQRLNAEYTNYRRRVERDRVVERERAVGDAARAILPVLDDLDRAEAHGDLAEGGPLTTIASKLRAAVAKLGIVAYGEKGEGFDPREHDAIFQRPNPDVERPTVSDVVERGYRIGDSVLRVAKVVVDTPEG